MGTTVIVYYAKVGILLVLMLSLPPIIVATLVGLLVSIFQALTQIQEQTLSFAVKLIAIVVALVFVIPWAGSQMMEFTDQILTHFADITR